MNYLLDTCVISELIKPKPNSKVVKWLRSCQDETLFLSSLTIGEIQKKGISKLQNSRIRKKLQEWMDTELQQMISCLKNILRNLYHLDMDCTRYYNSGIMIIPIGSGEIK